MKIKRLTSFLICFVAGPSLLLCGAQSGAGRQFVTLKLTSGQVLQTRAVAPGIFRVRLGADEIFPPSLMERYGIVRSDWDGEPFIMDSNADEVAMRTTHGELTIRKADGCSTLRDAKGRVLVSEIAPLFSKMSAQQRLNHSRRCEALVDAFRNDSYPGMAIGDTAPQPPSIESRADSTGPGFGFSCRLEKGDRFYGLGTASKQHIQMRGRQVYNWVRYQRDEQPVPFVMSTGGWGLYLNTTWRHYMDIGKSDPDELFVWGPEGDLDFFLILGPDLPTILDRYTQITGRPMLMPLWSYGLTWADAYYANQHEVLENARTFRKEGIPCDGIGLEPGWMKKNYDYSTKVEWNTERFYIPGWLRGPVGRNQTFIWALRRYGFKLHLWLCCDYDLTYEEERAIADREGKSFTPGPEAWFDHLRSFIDDGVVAWKLDPAKFVSSIDPSRKYANGRCEFEMHNLNQVLAPKQMMEGQKRYTQLRPMMQYCGGYAGTQRWAAQTVGDIMLGAEGLTWMLCASLSGYMNVCGDMYVTDPTTEMLEGAPKTGPTTLWRDGVSLHVGFLSPWTLMDAWAFVYQPWWSGGKLERMVREYARLRYSLLPYIYSAAHVGARTGMPIMRPMPLLFPDEPALGDNVNQFTLGDYLLVTAFTPTVHFPPGRWIDYWTGKEYRGPAEINYSIPEDRGGGLFIKAGAILPYWPEMDYVGQRPVDTLSLHVYPEGESRFTLYEDDGLTLGYEKGEIAETEITCRAGGAGAAVAIAPRRGTYQGMPADRHFNLWIHGPKPGKVLLDGKVLREGSEGWQYDKAGGAVRMAIGEDPERKASKTIQITSLVRP